eukprot:7006632-Heterocapsa_arctica.AAC.1
MATPGSNFPLSTSSRLVVLHEAYFLGQSASANLPLRGLISLCVNGSTAAPYVALLCPPGLMILTFSLTASASA